jgi:rubrerythrin
MATPQEFLSELESLAQLDVDAVHAYTAAIQRITLPAVQQQLRLFREDHERHIADLAPLIERFGGKVPTRSPDFKGFFITGFTAIRSMMSNEQALKAMRSNEETTNDAYAKALECDFPADIREVVERNREDERRHLAYVNGCLDEKIWERPEADAA